MSTKPKISGEEAKEDRISSLCDDLIHKIMSFMHTKYAVQTCVLSKRWKLVWKSLPYLNLMMSCEFLDEEDPTEEEYEEEFSSLNNLINQVLHRRYNSNLVKVYVQDLSRYHFPDEPRFTLEGLIAYAVNHNVQQLAFQSMDLSNFAMPESFSNCKSLTALEFDNCKWHNFTFLELPALKSLRYDSVEMTQDFFNNPKSLLGCPNLETLELISLRDRGWREDRTLFINAPNLKRLELSFFPYLRLLYLSCNVDKVVIDAPRLVSFKYKGSPPVVCSSHDFASIHDVYFDIYKAYGRDHVQLINTLNKFRPMKSLTLSSQTVEY
ncbi:hypothetical protein COLO4_38583 [Corchorus olitorius]|uniref:Uncharacterized protein n=1 Tax=Corchorus olitorius TaxID=93759 RepID=A0A1R3FU08_9ROSI|nr:hypothetical protein COLO4_38583 [Corchorus olitorius]